MTAPTALPPVAMVDEPRCIGCALCLKVCPTDAIVGAHRWLHVVIAADCTGCRKCIPVCPTDCIAMVPRADDAPPRELAHRWRLRVQARRLRLARDRDRELQARAAARARLLGPPA